MLPILVLAITCDGVLASGNNTPDHGTRRQRHHREQMESVKNSGRVFDEMGNRGHATSDTVLWDNSDSGAGGNSPI